MKTKALAFVASCYFLFGFISLIPVSREFDAVNVTGGLVSGTTNAAGDIHIFRGIPFAAPPVGNLRWKAPQPVIPWSGVRKCDAFGPSPVQGSPNPFGPWSAEFLIPKEPISEDCLYLNVWTGAKSATEKRPVLVWIYGGGFNSGGTGVPIYDGEATAKKGVIFVSMNYRVGPFGFFSHPELTKESGRNASGNYGLMDQIAALQWVKQNIARFGGDPANVTIAGQSAGSMSVNALVASPVAKNLFTKAIAESGANFSRPAATLSQAEEAGLKMAQSMGASSLAELRAKPADELLKKAQGRGLVIDGYVLPQPVADIFAAGKQNDVRLLTGWNEDEGMVFGPAKKADDYRKQINEQYGASADTFLKFYPAGTDVEAASSQVKVSRDMVFGAQNYQWATIQSQKGKTAYVYRFARKVPATGEYARYGAFHTGELAYAYDNLKFIDHALRPLEPVDTRLANEMSAYWVNFIKTGNPNGKGLPDWPAYSTTDKPIMIFDKKTGVQSLPDGPALEFLLTTMRKR
ncbi:carboxylesterase/lipase family protein [Spirosoma fluviale]|uniref:Carboxylic ester hydrolase n=1 Tax=Spirosoma fluviale TaxID=1597977 RepID=A0A286FC34_9BACT|nr:carboxylesterase family protein [Spirosoma fluviale]SOD80549.1 para-nitrobenzyl esterase [Spirosoma fluviale]